MRGLASPKPAHCAACSNFHLASCGPLRLAVGGGEGAFLASRCLGSLGGAAGRKRSGSISLRSRATPVTARAVDRFRGARGLARMTVPRTVIKRRAQTCAGLPPRNRPTARLAQIFARPLAATAPCGWRWRGGFPCVSVFGFFRRRSGPQEVGLNIAAVPGCARDCPRSGPVSGRPRTRADDSPPDCHQASRSNMRGLASPKPAHCAACSNFHPAPCGPLRLAVGGGEGLSLRLGVWVL